MLQALVIAWAGVCAAQAAPGPNMMAVAGAALRQGRGAALLVVSGIATGSLVWAAAVAIGFGALFSAVPALLTLLKFAGGAYLLYLAVRAVVAAIRGSAVSIRDGSEELSPLGAWRRGCLVVLTNPKAALMWSAVATFLYGAGYSNLEVLGFGPLVALSAALIYGTYGLLFSSGLAVSAYRRFARWIEAVFGALFGALGVMLLADGVRSLR